MSDELRQLLHDTATAPTRSVDASAVVRRARRQRVAVRVTSGAAVLLVVVVALAGVQALWPQSSPEIADTPPSGEPTISVLDTPRESEDAVPEHLREPLGLESPWADTSRLARRTATHDYYVYRNEAMERSAERAQGPSSDVCLLVVPHGGTDWSAGCSGGTGRVGYAILTLGTGSGVLAGVVYDGIDNTSSLAGETPGGLPVINNVFTSEDAGG